MDGDVVEGRLPARWYGWYLYAEAAAVAAWWIALAISPEVVRMFRWPGIPTEVLYAFLVPDAVLVMGAGAVAAWGLQHRRPWGWAAAHVHLGGVAYPGLLTIALCVATDGGWLGAAVMAAQSAVGAIAMFVNRPRAPRRDVIAA